MPETRYISTDQAAGALGVGVSTIKRWVDDGILPAHRTAGGHRKLLVADVLRLARDGEFPRVDLGRLQPVDRKKEGLEPAGLSRRLLSAFKRGDGDSVRALIHGAYRSGIEMDTLADFVIAPAVNELGHEWESGRLEVFHEHRGTQLCVASLYELKALLEEERAGRDQPIAVGGSLESDTYVLPSLLAELVLLDAGWQVIALGAHTPIRSFRRAIEELHPRLLWISISRLEEPDRFVAEYRDLYREAERAGVAVAIGGRALTESVRADLPYTCYGDGLRHLAAFARSCHRPPSRPRRGRPFRRP